MRIALGRHTFYHRATAMFYWIPDEDAHKIHTALGLVKELYPDTTFAADMLITVGKTSMFLYEPKFINSFNASARTDQEKSLVWRLHVLVWAAKNAMNLTGDFVECGVLHGFSSSVICRYLDFATLPRTFYLYDTFYGPPKEVASEHEVSGWGRASRVNTPEENLAFVRSTFAPYPNVRIVPGIIPDTFKEACPDKITYLHVDMNSERGEILALEALYDRVVPGGVIVLDDFGWACNRGQAIAELKFFSARRVAILELPTGQGVVVKPPTGL